MSLENRKDICNKSRWWMDIKSICGCRIIEIDLMKMLPGKLVMGIKLYFGNIIT